MAVRYDRNLGMWQSDQVGGSYYSKEDASAAETGGSLSYTPQQSPDTLEIGTGGITAQRPDDPRDAPNPNNPGGISDNQLTKNTLQQRGNVAGFRSGANTTNPNTGAVGSGAGGGGVTGAFNLQRQSAVGNEWTGDGPAPVGSFVRDSNGNPVYVRGDRYAGESANIWSRMGTVTDHGMVGGVQELGFEPPATAPGGGGGAGAGGRTDGSQQTGEAQTRFNDEDAENSRENATAWNNAWNAIDNIQGGDYALSDEARGYQREGLAQQRMLLEKMLAFDPKQYASQYADQTLARQIAAGRSAGGSYASQQAGMFAAAEQAPSLYAEGARQATGIENQRLGMAQQAAKSFGELGTMTRGQDEQRAQFESNLTVEIADKVTALTQGQVSLNQQESQMFAEMWMDFAKLQSVYAGMSSDEQIAWWQTEASKRGQDKQLEGILASLRAGGEVTSKDLVGGLFQLGGGLISTVGRMGAAA